jgi:hypothetical protein
MRQKPRYLQRLVRPGSGVGSCGSVYVQINAPSKGDWDKITSDNLINAEILTASKFLVDIRHNIIPSKGLEKGSPILRADEAM